MALPNTLVNWFVFWILVPFLLFEQKSDDKEPLSELRIFVGLEKFGPLERGEGKNPTDGGVAGRGCRNRAQTVCGENGKCYTGV